MPLLPAKRQKTPACIRQIQVHKLWTKVYSQKGLTAARVLYHAVLGVVQRMVLALTQWCHTLWETHTTYSPLLNFWDAGQLAAFNIGFWNTKAWFSSLKAENATQLLCNELLQQAGLWKGLKILFSTKCPYTKVNRNIQTDKMKRGEASIYIYIYIYIYISLIGRV